MEVKIRKLQQFFILKFPSDRLKKSNYNINITLDQARINSEIITINNSELLRTLFRYKKVNFSQTELDILLNLQKKLRKAENNEENRKKLANTTERIEKILFIEDLVHIEFKNKSHYINILKKGGFYVNGTRYVPFMATAGMIRKNTAMFINNNLKHPIMDILENGRNETVPLVSAKFGAYFSLYCSSTTPVSFPKFAVIPDKEMQSLQKVDFVTYKGVGEDDDVVEKELSLTTNMWDGQGLITPKLAKQWSDEMELDYTFSCAIIRAPFLKGLICVFDVLKFANEIVKDYTFTDIYGQELDARDYDLFISESMFKLWNAYENTQAYAGNCNKNKLGFSIAKVNPKKESNHSRTSYQFLQVLNLTDADIAKLCEPTIQWFRNISGGSPVDMLLYATGESRFEPTDFEKMDISVRAILLNPSLSRDKYIQEKFIKTIEKKKKESFMGSLLINSNYQFMVGDPYYQASHLFKFDTPPLLKENQHYSEYWLKRKIRRVGAIRSPIVHHSEFNILNLQDRRDTKNWFQHIHSGIIYPANGISMDCAIHGGSDFDGDLVCTFNNVPMMNGRIQGNPIVYESQKAEKTIVDARNDKEQVEGQLKGYNSKVGFATNISSSLYTMLEEFPQGTIEHDTILKRLKIGRVIQGEIIDGVKGLTVPPFREHWTKFKKITDEMSPAEKEKWEFNNTILCEIRPSYFRFLYPHYMSRYNKELKRYNIYCQLVFGKSFDEIYKNSGNRTPEEEEIFMRYGQTSYFLDNTSTVNRISTYMRINVGLVGKYSLKSAQHFDYTILKNPAYELNPYALHQMKECLQKYKAFRRGLRRDLSAVYSNTDAFTAYLRKECAENISTNESELANYAIEATYGDETSMVEFAWRIAGSGILQNIMENSTGIIRIPVEDENGEIEYLWSRYTIKEYDLKDLYHHEE